MKPKQFEHVTVYGVKEILLHEIGREVKDAEAKFRYWPVAVDSGMMIVNEEMGEANKTAVDLTWGHGDRIRLKKELRVELVQTAAMCIRMIAALDFTPTPKANGG